MIDSATPCLAINFLVAAWSFHIIE
ncbi:photosystem I protein PsaX [Nostoc sp.]